MINPLIEFLKFINYDSRRKSIDLGKKTERKCS